jgi:hypothetical protein
MKTSYNRKKVSNIGQIEKHRDKIGRHQSEELERAKAQMRRDAARQAAEEEENAKKRNVSNEPPSKMASWVCFLIFILMLLGLYAAFKVHS